jgi:hypothetical protein
MPRAVDNLTPKKNVTEERLRATPFENVRELEAEGKAIRLAVWRKFSEAQVIHELLTKPENTFIIDEWKAGLVAFYGTDSKERIFKIFSEGKGLKLELNKEFTQTLGEHEIRFVEGVVRAGIEGYGFLYMRAKSLIRDNESSGDALTGALAISMREEKRKSKKT